MSEPGGARLRAHRYAWAAMVGTALVAAAAYAAVADRLVLSRVIYVGYGVFSVLVTGLAIDRERPRPAAPWWVLTAGLGCYVLGDACGFAGFTVATLALWRAAPIVWTAGFLLGARARRTRLGVQPLLDAVMAGVAVTAVFWILGVIPQGDEVRLITTPGHPGVLAFMSLVVLLVVVLGMTFQSDSTAVGPTALLVVAVMLGLGCALVEYVLIVQDGVTYVEDLTSDGPLATLSYAGFLVVYGMFAAAALHPQMRMMYRQEETDVPELGAIRLLVIGGSVLVAPLVAMMLYVRGEPIPFGFVTGTTLLLLAIAVWRLTHIMRLLTLSRRRDEVMRDYNERLLLAHGTEEAIAITSAAARELIGVPVEVRPGGPHGPGLVSVALPTVDGPPLDLVAPDAAIGMSSQRVALRMLAASLSAKLAREASVERQNDLALLKGEHQRLLDLEEMQQAFISMVTHELRTPLTSLRGYLDLVLDGDGGPLTEDQRAWLGVMDRNVQRLAALVEDMLTLAREQATTHVSAMEDVDVAALVERSVEVSRPAADAQGLSLTGDTAAHLPGVRGEPRSLAQLLDNLVANAVKFTPEGGAVTIAARYEDPHVVLEVADTGPGIPADELPHVFDRFFRASTGKNVPGTGLGLSIAKAIVDNHGGTLDVRSELGVGSTFRVTLPAAAEPRAELATEHAGA